MLAARPGGLAIGVACLLHGHLLFARAQEAVTNAPTDTKEVLLLFSEARDLPGNAMLEQSVRATMSRGLRTRLEFYVESLDAGRFPEESHAQFFKAYLEKKYLPRDLDLVLVVMARDFGLAERLPPGIAAKVPVIFAAINELGPPFGTTNQRITGIIQRFDVDGTVAFIRRLQPATRRIVVIGGTSIGDRATLGRIEAVARGMPDVAFDFWTNRPMAELRQAVRTLPPDSVILLGPVQKDAADETFYTSQVAQMLAPGASVPVYVLGAGSIGSGALGGNVVDLDNLGSDLGELGLRALAGTALSQIPAEYRTNGTPMVDWRALQRWRISPGNLPAGCVVRHRPRSLWEENKGIILSGIAILLAQAVTIAGMLAQRRYRRRAEAAARENQAARALLAAIVESSEDAIIRTELNGRIVTWNRSAERLFGYSTAEALGQSISLIIPETLEKERTQTFEQIRKGESIQYYETFRRRKDGSRVEVSLAISPIRDESGRIVGASKICRDITARKQAEAEIQRQRTELAHVTRVSTLGQLASALAHELNQPLGAILRNAEAAEIFLKRESPDLEEIRAILADIRKDDQRAGKVIDRMRTLLQKRSLNYVRLDLRELVEDTVALSQPDARQRRVKLTQEFLAPVPPVRGDRVHLQQVLLNLILNGMDAMEAVPAETRQLRVQVQDGENGDAQVAVIDGGCGLRAEEMPRLFEAFFSTKSAGLGMGLAISRTIIEAHGGRIWAFNNPDRGATFAFTLPREQR